MTLSEWINRENVRGLAQQGKGDLDLLADPNPQHVPQEWLDWLERQTAREDYSWLDEENP